MHRSKYYAVKNGRKPGVYTTWADCQKQVNGYPNAIFKSFHTDWEAEAYINSKPSVEQENKQFIYDSLAEYTSEMFIKVSAEMSDTAFCFVDGSNIKSEAYSYGLIMFFNGEMITRKGVGSNKAHGQFNNVAGELLGAIHAVHLAEEKGAKALVIYHDYEGIRAWANKDWTAKIEMAVNYADLVRDKRDIMTIDFVKVAGHTGVPVNEMVDKLAKSALNIK